MAPSDCVDPCNETIQPVLVCPFPVCIVVEAYSEEYVLLNVSCIYRW